MYLNGGSHEAFAMLDMTRANLVPFLTAYCKCDLNFNSRSKITLKYLTSLAGCMIVLLTLMRVSISRFFLFEK